MGALSRPPDQTRPAANAWLGADQLRARLAQLHWTHPIDRLLRCPCVKSAFGLLSIPVPRLVPFHFRLLYLPSLVSSL